MARGKVKTALDAGAPRIPARRLELIKVIAHPVRIMILEELAAAEVRCVSELEKFLNISQPNVSQHLALLRRLDLVGCYVDGKLTCYFLKEPLIVDLLALLKREYKSQLPFPSCCPAGRAGPRPPRGGAPEGRRRS